MQSGIHPDWGLEDYEHWLRFAKRLAPQLHLHAYSPMEIAHMCDVSGLSPRAVLERLRDAGLGSTPGTAAEVLHDGVRERISPNKLPVARWVEIIEASHAEGEKRYAGQQGEHRDDRGNTESAPAAGCGPSLTRGLRPKSSPAQTPRAPMGPLEFDNGIGGFDSAAREYAITLADGRCTPMPWINVVANSSFGFLVSAEGGGYTWSINSQQNPITPWPNDPISDTPHEVMYLRDEDSGDLGDQPGCGDRPFEEQADEVLALLVADAQRRL